MKNIHTHRNSHLLNEMASLFEKHRLALAEANSLDSMTNLGVNLDNVDRGTATLRSYANSVIHETRSSRGGIAIYSCYGDPSFVSLGLSLAPALLANGSELPILLYFPSLLKSYSQLFASILSESSTFKNIRFASSSKEFFDMALHDDIFSSLLIYGDTWVEQYLPMVEEKRKTLLYFGPGNNTVVVLDNHDLKSRAHRIARLTCIVSGQAAICHKRCIISRDVDTGRFFELLKAEFLQIKTGLNPETDFVTPIHYPSIVRLAEHSIEHAVTTGAEAWSYSLIDTVFGTLVNPAIIIEPDANSKLWQHYHFIPALSIKVAENSEIEELLNKNEYPLAVSIYGENAISARLRNHCKNNHAFVFENSDFLDLITPQQGYSGPWGGYGKSAFLFSPDHCETEHGLIVPKDGLFDLYKIFTHEIA